jgi:hypothetical protein
MSQNFLQNLSPLKPLFSKRLCEKKTNYLPLILGLFKFDAVKTVMDVTHDAYFANGLHLAKNGTGQSFFNSL